MEFTERYAFVDKLEKVAGRIHALFDVVDLRSLEAALLLEPAQWRDVLARLVSTPAFILDLVIESTGRDEGLALALRRMREDRWCKVRLGPSGAGTPALRYKRPADTECDEVGLIGVSGLGDGERKAGRALARAYSLDRFQEASAADLKAALCVDTGSPRLGVYHVGQGSCNALIGVGEHPALYFDFGGGCYRNTSTFPTNMRFCLMDSPLIVLSHWDFDHWVAADKFPQAQSMTWVVPKQKLGPHHYQLAERIGKQGKLLVWGDSGPAMIQTPYGVFTRASGKGRNHSGIVLRVDIKIDGEETPRSVLMPGDAAYRHIAPGQLGGLSYLVASHHGGNHRGDKPPTASVPGAVVYSFGSGNSCGHPHPRSLKRHQDAGWNSRFDTPQGHVLLGSQDPVAGVPACGGTDCDLQPKQFA